MYDSALLLPTPDNLNQFVPYDDYTLVPYDQGPLLDQVDHSITLNLQMGDLGNGAN